jgi:hypothetical protein
MKLIGLAIALVVLAAFLVPALLCGGWIIMLCLGALAHIFGVAGLAIAFWPSVLVSVILGVLFG